MIKTQDSAAEADLERVGQYEAHRAQVLSITAPQQAELTRSLSDLDTALDGTRAARVLGLHASPDAETADLLGAPPPTAAGAAAWCHYALAVETVRDHEPPTNDRAWKLMQMCANIGPTIALADAANIDLSGIAVDPDTWAQCATRARELASGDQQHLDSPLLTRVARTRPEFDIGL